MKTKTPKLWWVYVLHSQKERLSIRTGKILSGFYYVGSTTDVVRRLRQHNGEITGGGKFTSKNRPHILVAVFGPYNNRSEALKAEMTLKHGKSGIARTKWSIEDSTLCCGLGINDPLVLELSINNKSLDDGNIVLSKL